MVKIYKEAIENIKQYGSNLFYNDLYIIKIDLYGKFNFIKNELYKIYDKNFEVSNDNDTVYITEKTKTKDLLGEYSIASIFYL